MSQIYANAYLTVAAAHSSGDGIGILTERPGKTISIKVT